jgi:hypothetical protein
VSVWSGRCCCPSFLCLAALMFLSFFLGFFHEKTEWCFLRCGLFVQLSRMCVAKGSAEESLRYTEYYSFFLCRFCSLGCTCLNWIGEIKGSKVTKQEIKYRTGESKLKTRANWKNSTTSNSFGVKLLVSGVVNSWLLQSKALLSIWSSHLDLGGLPSIAQKVLQITTETLYWGAELVVQMQQSQGCSFSTVCLLYWYSCPRAFCVSHSAQWQEGAADLHSGNGVALDPRFAPPRNRRTWRCCVQDGAVAILDGCLRKWV